jgi:hypothetical protein
MQTCAGMELPGRTGASQVCQAGGPSKAIDSYHWTTGRVMASLA